MFLGLLHVKLPLVSVRNRLLSYISYFEPSDLIHVKEMFDLFLSFGFLELRLCFSLAASPSVGILLFVVELLFLDLIIALDYLLEWKSAQELGTVGVDILLAGEFPQNHVFVVKVRGLMFFSLPIALMALPRYYLVVVHHFYLEGIGVDDWLFEWRLFWWRWGVEYSVSFSLDSFQIAQYLIVHIWLELLEALAQGLFVK